jgi:hypothetical protein
MFALALGSGAARRFESNPTDANEPIDMGQLKPGRRTANQNGKSERQTYFKIT